MSVSKPHPVPLPEAFPVAESSAELINSWSGTAALAPPNEDAELRSADRIDWGRDSNSILDSEAEVVEAKLGGNEDDSEP